jgi:hypothetical protein
MRYVSECVLDSGISVKLNSVVKDIWNRLICTSGSLRIYDFGIMTNSDFVFWEEVHPEDAKVITNFLFYDHIIPRPQVYRFSKNYYHNGRYINSEDKVRGLFPEYLRGREIVTGLREAVRYVLKVVYTYFDDDGWFDGVTAEPEAKIADQLFTLHPGLMSIFGEGVDSPRHLLANSMVTYFKRSRVDRLLSLHADEVTLDLKLDCQLFDRSGITMCECDICNGYGYRDCDVNTDGIVSRLAGVKRGKYKVIFDVNNHDDCPIPRRKVGITYVYARHYPVGCEHFHMMEMSRESLYDYLIDMVGNVVLMLCRFTDAYRRLIDRIDENINSDWINKDLYIHTRWVHRILIFNWNGKWYYPNNDNYYISLFNVFVNGRFDFEMVEKIIKFLKSVFLYKFIPAFSNVETLGEYDPREVFYHLNIHYGSSESLWSDGGVLYGLSEAIKFPWELEDLDEMT